MGRISLVDKAKYVEYNSTTNRSKCLQCHKELKGHLLGNIKRHYEARHNNTFVTELADIATVRRENLPKAQLNLCKEEFLTCCVGLVTVKNLPFRIFDDDKYFKKLLKPYSDTYRLTVNSKNISDHLNTYATEIKIKLKHILKNRIISLKIDVASRMGKSILGINVQYIQDFKINIHTIGMVQLKHRHSASFIRDEITKCLESFDISLKQVYSTTTDNGRNIIKASKLLLEEAQSEVVDYASDIEDECYDIEILNERIESLLPVVRCAAHTLQLAANDFFKKVEKEIESAKYFIKKLRSAVRNCDGIPFDITMPPIDTVTRWNSTFYMIEALLDLKDYLTTNYKDGGVNWNFVEKFVTAFSPMAECCKRLQTEQYIIGDFYRDWLMCEVKLKKLAENEYAVQLLELMKKRKTKLLENVAFLSALYFDPRFNFFESPYYNDEQRKIAMTHILKTYANTKSVSNIPNDESNDATCSFVNIQPDDPYGDLEEEYNLQRCDTITNITIRQKLERSAHHERKPFSVNVLEYWRETTADKDIRALVEITLAVPSSQVSVERAFSALPTIITKQRTNLTGDSINNILIVKLNEDLLHFDNF